MKARMSFGTLVAIGLFMVAMAAYGQEPIKIGVVGPFTGPAAYDGLSELVGAQVAAQEINNTGGVLGRKIEIVSADSRAIPAESVSAYKKLVTQDKVVAMVCCFFSSSTIATMPTMDELKIPTVNGVSFLPDAKTTKLTWLLKFAHTPRMESRFADYWVQAMGVKRVAFLTRNDDWGRITSGVYQARFKELGGTVLSSELITPGEKDFYAYLTKLKGLNPEAVNIVDIGAVMATIMKQMAELGVKAKVLASDAPMQDAILKILGPLAEGVPMVTRYTETIDTPRNKKFVAAYRAIRNGDYPDNVAQPGYDAIYILVEAIRRAGNTDATKVREQLLKTDYVSISGSRIRFDENQQATPKIFVAVVREGRRVIVQEIETSGVAY